jgi:phage terminase small subunit
MSVLSNPKWELFAQFCAKGVEEVDAYEKAGFVRHYANARRLSLNEAVRSRIEEILSAAAQRTEITVAKVLNELAKIAFGDLRKAVRWRGNLVEIREADPNAPDEVAIIKLIVNNQVELVDCDKLDDDTASTIAEVKQNVTGGVSIKRYDKVRALQLIGEYLSMWKGDADRPADGVKPSEIDRPPPESYEDYLARRRAEMGLESPARPPGRSH